MKKGEKPYDGTPAARKKRASVAVQGRKNGPAGASGKSALMVARISWKAG